MTKDDFIKKAINNGVDNDNKNVWVVVDGYRYTTTIDDELDYNDEDQPYMASYYLETYTVSSAWDDLYEQYCCREGNKGMLKVLTIILIAILINVCISD